MFLQLIHTMLNYDISIYKPILLSIGYSSCHWCHVMEHESFEDEKVAQLLNENYISIKVDREELPEVQSVRQVMHRYF